MIIFVNFPFLNSSFLYFDFTFKPHHKSTITSSMSVCSEKEKEKEKKKKNTSALTVTF